MSLGQCLCVMRLSSSFQLYEANWWELVAAGSLARVECLEVQCTMTKEFYSKYLQSRQAWQQRLLYVMNPTKIQVFARMHLLCTLCHMCACVRTCTVPLCTPCAPPVCVCAPSVLSAGPW